jgi:hypothetical protein
MSRTIVFIHGLWIHSSSWQPWMEFFEQHGYKTLNPAWPGDAATVAECRANPGTNRQSRCDRNSRQLCASHRITARTAHSDRSFFGGLLAQVLLGRGIAAAGIAIDPARFERGMATAHISAAGIAAGAGQSFNINKAKSLTFGQFTYGFANAVPEQEARELYERWTIPAPCRPLFQAAMATIAPVTQTQVDTENTTRGPLLITAGQG